MSALTFSGRRIKSPERGLLSMHPFVDVLEGRSLFTATAHPGVMDVTAVVDAQAAGDASNPWSTEYIDPADSRPPAAGGPAAEPGTSGLPALLAATTPGRIELEAGTTGSAFAAGGPIGDTAQTLFGNALWDRRGDGTPAALPTEAELAVAREARALAASTSATVQRGGTPFRDGRTLTGAMRPYLTMAIDQTNHPFAA